MLILSYLSIVIPLFKSTGFMAKMSIIYLSSWKDDFIIKPIKTKQKHLLIGEIRQNYLYQIIKFPCQVNEKPVATNHNAIFCNICDCWEHIHCNNIWKQTYRQLQKDPRPWYDKSCLKKEISFSNLNDSEFEAFTSGLNILP